MRRRIRGPLPLPYVFLLTFVIFTLTSLSSLWFINRGLRPTFLNIAERETERIANSVINDALSDLTKGTGFNTKGLLEISKDQTGKINAVTVNTAIANQLMNAASDSVEQYLKEKAEGKMILGDTNDIGSGGIVYYIPIGQATKNTLLSNYGPRIPVRFFVISSVSSSLKDVVKPFGINNALVELNIHTQIRLQVVLPFASKIFIVENDTPLVIQIVQGEVPEYYNNGNIPLPTLKESKKTK